MRSEELVLVSVAHGVATVTLNRPAVANAVDLPTAAAIRQAVDRCHADDVRVVLLAGAGKRFCAGGDVRSFLAADDPQAHLLELATMLEAALCRLSGLAKPVVAAAQGAAAGAGLALILTADLVVTGASAKFSTAYADIGLTPDCGVSYLLPRVVGLRHALDLTLNRRTLTADEALDWGLVSEVVDDAAVSSRATEVALSIAEGPTTALGQARRLLRSSYELPREQHAADEAVTIAASVTTAEARELIQRFTHR